MLPRVLLLLAVVAMALSVVVSHMMPAPAGPSAASPPSTVVSVEPANIGSAAAVEPANGHGQCLAACDAFIGDSTCPLALGSSDVAPAAQPGTAARVTSIMLERVVVPKTTAGEQQLVSLHSLCISRT
jgi:hypothetical protein